MPILKEGEPPPVALSRASLVILSESLLPDEISARTGLEPDATWRRGEPRGSSGAVQKFNGWELGSGLARVANPDSHVHALLGRLRPQWARVKALIQDEPGIDARLWITQHIENWNPGFHFDPEPLRDIAELGVMVEIEAYCYDLGELANRREGVTDASPPSPESIRH